MKELSIEEKAQAYDKAIEYAHYLINERCKEGTDDSFHRADLQKMFPELKESEDEKIRKALLEMVHDTTGDSLWVDYNVHKEDAIAWLEKRGEQKPAETEKGTNGNEREIPNSAWSDGDIVAIDCAVDVLSKDLPSLAASIERLKSLRPQYTWKPSDEQISIIEFIMEDIEKDSIRYAVLNNILEQLKKLREK